MADIGANQRLQATQCRATASVVKFELGAARHWSPEPNVRPHQNWSAELFERFTDSVTVVNLARQGNLEKLHKLIRGGCRIDRRTTYDPWMTPLDAAAAAGNEICADFLLGSGAPLWGSSIFEAIRVDSRPVLEVFHKYDVSFFRNFWEDKEFSQNPRLNRWLLHFTALDYALSIGATACSKFLTGIGAPKKEKFTKCWSGHYAPRIKDESFVSFGGVNVDGLCEVTEGYYCAKCKSFIRGAV